MNWIFYQEEPALIERSGPFSLVATAHEVFWDLQENDGVVKLAHYDNYHFKPDFCFMEEIRKYWVYEFSESEFLEVATKDRSLTISDFFKQAGTFGKWEWRVLAGIAELAPKIARFNMKRERRIYLGAGKFDEPRLEISVISDQRNKTLSLRNIDNTWALGYELNQEDIERVIENLKFELIEGLHLHLQNRDLEYWVYLSEAIKNEAEMVALKPNDMVWDVNEWMK